MLIGHRLSSIEASQWRHGDVAGMPKLRAILEMAGRHPSSDVLDYRACFARNIRVLSVAPAFGPMVAEAALAMALTAARDVVSGSAAFGTGSEQYQHRGNEGCFTLYDKTVGLIGCGSLARNLMPLLAPFRCKLLGYDPWVSDRYLARMGLQPAARRWIPGTRIRRAGGPRQMRGGPRLDGPHERTTHQSCDELPVHFADSVCGARAQARLLRPTRRHRHRGDHRRRATAGRADLAPRRRACLDCRR